MNFEDHCMIQEILLRVILISNAPIIPWKTTATKKLLCVFKQDPFTVGFHVITPDENECCCFPPVYMIFEENRPLKMLKPDVFQGQLAS